MKVSKLFAGPVLAAGLGIAAFAGAGTASALGLSADLNGDGQSFDIGSGATTSQTGNASGNPALAVSLLGPASTSATGNAHGNTLIAVDGQVSVGGNSNGNTIVQVGNKSSSTGQGNKPGETSIEVCGFNFTGQADHVTTSSQAGGIC